MGENTTCPDICPKFGDGTKRVRFEDDRRRVGEATDVAADTSAPHPENPHARPYILGLIQPPERRMAHPTDAPPLYLPQPTDSNSGDILGMSPTGPWASGHLDWTPISGATGTRPVVDRYSITRYSLSEWRSHNERALAPKPIIESKAVDKKAQEAIKLTFTDGERMQTDNTNKLKQKAAVLSRWKSEVERTIKNISDEVIRLEEERQRLKSAGKVLMMPETIAAECIELRSNRLEPDLVRDLAEQELIIEMSLVGEIRKAFNKTLMDIEEQLAYNKAAKASIEFDWSDKKVAYDTETLNASLTNKSNTVLFHQASGRFKDNCSTGQYWEHFCRENIQQCEAVRQKSIDLRGTLSEILQKGGRDISNQAARTNAALADTVSMTENVCDKLEENLKEILQSITDTENLVDDLKRAVRKMDATMKVAQTRLDNRNFGRPNVENSLDEPQYGLIAENKRINENVSKLLSEIRNADSSRAMLMKKRGDLEKEIAVKRKSLIIDRDRCGFIRSHYPSAQELAGE